MRFLTNKVLQKRTIFRRKQSAKNINETQSGRDRVHCGPVSIRALVTYTPDFSILACNRRQMLIASSATWSAFMWIFNFQWLYDKK